MRTRGLLVAVLLGMGLCFVPALGYGEIEHPKEAYPSKLDFILLNAELRYVLGNPTNFLDIMIRYDEYGVWGMIGKFPETVDTKDKIYIQTRDTRGTFSDKSGIALRSQFKKQLEVIYSLINIIATNMRTDIVAKFLSEEEFPLGYFYQGEYHLWEK